VNHKLQGLCRGGLIDEDFLHHRADDRLARWQRIAMMDKEILDVEGAATLLGVSTTTIYNLARKGEIPATRVGREWRFARSNLIQWVANGTAADQLSVALSRGRVAKRK
jgi:excisionase family DNA binding protein